MARILVIGSGGREHAILWALAQEGGHDLTCAPGNAGTAQLARNLPLGVGDHQAIAEAVRRENIDLTVVGPELPLAEGLVDLFSEWIPPGQDRRIKPLCHSSRLNHKVHPSIGRSLHTRQIALLHPSVHGTATFHERRQSFHYTTPPSSRANHVAECIAAGFPGG